MFIYQFQLKSMKDLLMITDIVFPDQDSFISVITMSEIALTEYMKFLSDSTVFYQTFFPVL